MTKTATVVVVLVLCIVISNLTGSVYAQKAGNGVCRIEYRLVNKNRQIAGHLLSAECPGSIHSAPFGNWGVESNHDVRRNSRQFDGWKLIDNLYQWNSCTSNTTDFPTGCGGTEYYNHSNCTEQFSNTGVPNWGIHAGVAPNTLYVECTVSCAPEGNGCLEANNTEIAVADHFMKMYELDSPGTDVLTGHLVFGTQVVRSICLDPMACDSSISSWDAAADSSTGVSAEAAVEIIGGSFIDKWGQCQP